MIVASGTQDIPIGKSQRISFKTSDYSCLEDCGVFSEHHLAYTDLGFINHMLVVSFYLCLKVE